MMNATAKSGGVYLYANQQVTLGACGCAQLRRQQAQGAAMPRCAERPPLTLPPLSLPRRRAAMAGGSISTAARRWWSMGTWWRRWAQLPGVNSYLSRSGAMAADATMGLGSSWDPALHTGWDPGSPHKCPHFCSTPPCRPHPQQGSQFSLAEVEVVTATVDLDAVVSYRGAGEVSRRGAEGRRGGTGTGGPTRVGAGRCAAAVQRVAISPAPAVPSRGAQWRACRSRRAARSRCR